MIEQWLAAIEDLILDAPGNADEEVGTLWDSTLDRLGEDDKEEARENRFFWDYFEADEDVSDQRPFFVLTEVELGWEKYALQHLTSVGAIEVCFTEQVLSTATTHKEAKEYFAAWTSALIKNCAERMDSCAVEIAAIRQTVFPQRTPRQQRDPDRPETDYFWAAWQFLIGTKTGMNV